MPNTGTNKFTRNDIEVALSRLRLMAFIPTDPAFQVSLGELLALICPHKEALEWLVRTLVDRVRKWPGAYEVRALLCTKYDAADGVDAPFCSIVGFRPEDYEAQYYERHQAIKAGGWEKPGEIIERLSKAHDMKQITGRKPN
jgi:hypothetical protein